MAQCEYEYPDGRRCRTAALTSIEAPDNSQPFCWNHSDDPDIVERRHDSRAKGGRSSRKVVDAPELRDLLEELKVSAEGDVVTVKKLVLCTMSALLDGRITPAQFRCLVGQGAITLRSLMELETYRELLNRLDRLEGRGERQLLLSEETWQVLDSEP